MRKKILIALALALCLSAWHCLWQLPASKTISLAPLSPSRQEILVPLDSRPVCTQLPQELAALAGTKLILPPKTFLDNYHEPAKTEKIYNWLGKELGQTDTTYLSTDMLLAGGLLQARKQASTAVQRSSLNQKLRRLQLQNKQLYIFQVIPRLLVSDELIPDRWYKYYLFRYAQLYDEATTFNDFAVTKQMLYYEHKIPPEVLNKYRGLYHAQDQLNTQLLQLANNCTSVIIGQDDGTPFGFPHRSAELAEQSIERSHIPLSQATVTYGADEIAAVLIARSYLQRSGYQPKVYIQYADHTIPNLVMPYLSTSVAGVLQEKLQLLGAQAVTTAEAADFILYVSCGNDFYHPHKQQAEQLAELLQKYKHVALLDLCANFEERELLLPQALSQGVPLNKLCAYAGWNTFSNSAGTVLAQACIYTGRLQELKTQTAKLQLTSANLAFNIKRFLDDYCYQKKLHAQLKKELLMRSIEPTELDARNTIYAQSLAQFFLQNQAYLLLHRNLGRTPYYKDALGSYYLQDIKLEATFPWNRIFEVKLKITPTFSKAECIRCFHTSFNTTPYKYLTELRIAKAVELLRTTDLPITEIAASVGFNQLSNFGKIFRENTNYTPREYRKLARE